MFKSCNTNMYTVDRVLYYSEIYIVYTVLCKIQNKYYNYYSFYFRLILLCSKFKRPFAVLLLSTKELPNRKVQ